jgi:hypothetical protein
MTMREGVGRVLRGRSAVGSRTERPGSSPVGLVPRQPPWLVRVLESSASHVFLTSKSGRNLSNSREHSIQLLQLALVFCHRIGMPQNYNLPGLKKR